MNDALTNLNADAFGRDPLFESVARYIVSSNNSDKEALQETFNITSERASKILNELEQECIVGPERHIIIRDIQLDEEDLEYLLLGLGY